MVQNCVFLSHQHNSAEDVYHLAEELRLRGIIPWVDKLPGGFLPGDGSVAEARRVIREEASAFVLYLTEKALTRSDFIRDEELPEALARKQREPAFPVFVISPHFRFSEISRLTREHYGVDLARDHGYVFDRTCDTSLADLFARSARGMLAKHLVTQHPADIRRLELQVSSWEVLPGSYDELVRIDATGLIHGDVAQPEVWRRVLSGLQEVKQAIAARYGRPQVLVTGSKHLTTAFVTGRVFNRFPLDIRQTPTEVWSTEGTSDELADFSVAYEPASHLRQNLIVEIATGYKDISRSVDALIATGALVPGSRLKVRPKAGRVRVTGAISRALADRVYRELDWAVNNHPCAAIHLFVAAPQASVMTFATLVQGMPPVHLYEWTDAGYIPTIVVPTAV